MPAYDPDLARLLDVARQAGRPPFEALTPEQARSAYAATWDILQPAAQDVASVRDSVVPGPDGDITVRIYRGIGTETSESLPCVLYLHGGGWVIGNLDSHDRFCRQLANVARVCVIAVDYRLRSTRFPQRSMTAPMSGNGSTRTRSRLRSTRAGPALPATVPGAIWPLCWPSWPAMARCLPARCRPWFIR